MRVIKEPIVYQDTNSSHTVKSPILRAISQLSRYKKIVGKILRPQHRRPSSSAAPARDSIRSRDISCTMLLNIAARGLIVRQISFFRNISFANFYPCRLYLEMLFCIIIFSFNEISVFCIRIYFKCSHIAFENIYSRKMNRTRI